MLLTHPPLANLPSCATCFCAKLSLALFTFASVQRQYSLLPDFSQPSRPLGRSLRAMNQTATLSAPLDAINSPLDLSQESFALPTARPSGLSHTTGQEHHPTGGSHVTGDLARVVVITLRLEYADGSTSAPMLSSPMLSNTWRSWDELTVQELSRARPTARQSLQQRRRQCRLRRGRRQPFTIKRGAETVRY